MRPRAEHIFGARGNVDLLSELGERPVTEPGVTRCALYHHFADKTELFAAVFEP